MEIIMQALAVNDQNRADFYLHIDKRLKAKHSEVRTNNIATGCFIALGALGVAGAITTLVVTCLTLLNPLIGISLFFLGMAIAIVALPFILSKKNKEIDAEY